MVCISSMHFKFNASKTELIWFNRLLPPATDTPHTVLNLCPDCSLKPLDVVRDLGVFLDNTLSLKFQIASITKSCFFHLRHIRQVKKNLNENFLRTLVQALVISRLDYCNSVLYGLPASTLQPLTTVLHCAAKLIKNLSPRDHVTLTLRELHWLPIPARINFKICLLMYRVYTNSSPSYMFPHLLHLVHLSNPDELYNLHLKLILLSHDQLENLETVPCISRT